jgi:hypothetical protein
MLQYRGAYTAVSWDRDKIFLKNGEQVKILKDGVVDCSKLSHYIWKC